MESVQVPRRLSLPPDLSRLPEVRAWAHEVGASASLPETRIFDLQVTVSEATANAIEHAASAVELTAWLLSDRLLVEVTNDGVFQPGLYKDHDGRRRGLGLPLIVSLADQVHVARLGDSATRVSLTFFLSGGSTAMPAAPMEPAAGSAGDMSGPPLALWLLLGAFVVAVAVLAALPQKAAYNPHGVFTAANIIFLTLVSLFVSVLAARAYLRGRPLSMLLIGCGTLALGLGAFLAAVHAGGPGTNPIPATYNSSALLAGLCYLGAAFWVRPAASNTRQSLRPLVLVASYAGIVILLALLVVAIRTGAWPLYFVQGQGPTTVGAMVARASALLFAISAIALIFAPGAVDAALRRWCGLGQGMIAIGLTAVSLQLALGDPLNWLGRSAQYVGCLVILAGIAYAALRSGVWALPLEQALAESEARYRNLVDLSPDGILVTAEGEHLFANPAAARLLGFRSPEGLIGASIFDHLHSEDREVEAQRISQIIAGAVAPPRELRLLRADGDVVWVEATGSRVEFQGRLAVQTVLRDITERRRAEEAVRQSEKSLARAESIADIGSWEWDIQTGDLRWSPGLYAIYGVDAASFMPTMEVFGAYVHPDDRETMNEIVSRCVGEGRSVDFDFRIVLADGSVRHIHARGEVVRFDEDGLPRVMMGVNQDVTEHRRAESALRESEERFRLLVEQAPDGIFLADAQGRYTDANTHGLAMLGCTLQELQQLAVTDVIIAEELPRMPQQMEGLSAGALLEDEWRFRRKDGSTFTGELLGRQLPDGRLLGILRDVTRRKESEGALRESEDRYRLLAEENERLYRQQLIIAEGLQLALLNIPLQIGQVKLGHVYHSATEAAQVGGDFYDVFEVKNGMIAVLIGDVAGHGIQAARTATLVKDVVHAFIHQSLRTHEVLRRTNGLLIEKELPGFITLFLGILDPATGRLRYSCAGHPEGLLRKAGGEIERLECGTAPLGIFPDAAWKPQTVELETGDVLVLYTDGVIEARRNGEFFGEERLGSVIERWNTSPERLPQAILDEVLAFSEGTLRDDVAVLAVMLSGKGNGGGATDQSPAPGSR